MDEKIPRVWLYIIVALLLAIAAVLIGRSLLTFKSDSSLTQGLADKSGELEEKDKQIQAMDGQIAQLRKDLEESSKRMDELRARLDETAKALSAEQRTKSTPREVDRPAASRPQPSEGVSPRPVEPAPSVASRRSAEPGTWEVLRDTAVLDRPSDTARKVATINKGTRVTVVRSTGDWLEVRSKHGNPPGYIRRDDAMFVEKIN
ncbi:MAG TPA: SH3 domain-containing protein [Candidatus Binatia bacterium]|jgi:TolA-binding protein|nr:SH3 domain-containing protein [Candidatus Binatia bacterium]